MKNIISIILTVVLTLTVVWAAGKLKDTGWVSRGGNVPVVSAARDLTAGEVVKKEDIAERSVPRKGVPAQAILWNKSALVAGQEVLRSVAKGDYIMLNDVGMNKNLSRIVAPGEWAVPVTFADRSLLQFIQPGDEIAVWATFTDEKIVRNPSEKSISVKEKTTSVLFPCVRVLDVGTGDGKPREEKMRNKTIIVSLPPQQVGLLIAAQGRAELFPALRTPNDTAARNRMEPGIVTDETFAGLRRGLKTVKVHGASGSR
ncbi:MAG: Flp pilus assembly protein CpaB [Lentisphaeria bacterium]|nr:Flp pilus assembly protein CpaB [Lentisphaeria bacterium]